MISVTPNTSISTRFAPSPTGLLHLGHAYSALVAHDYAHQCGGAFRLRIDDIDRGRSRPAFRQAIDEDLRWLGLIPDGEIVVQSQRFPLYLAALDRLHDDGLTYPCFCTRADIAASATAPHGPEGTLYPGTCRSLAPNDAANRIANGASYATRLNMKEAVRRSGPLCWFDGAGHRHDAQPEAHGDIILARRDSPTSYHLASSIDDAEMAISHVVRGADLLLATDIHRLLQALLGLPTPVYIHHDLVANAEGTRLAKRDDAASIASLRDAGIDPVALVADIRRGQLPLGYRWLTA